MNFLFVLKYLIRKVKTIMCAIKRVYLGSKIKFISSCEELFEITYKELCNKYGEENLRVEISPDRELSDGCLSL